MKKMFGSAFIAAIFASACIFTSCASTSSTEPEVLRVEKEMVLPDGAVADIYFFKGWFGSGAGAFEKQLRTRIASEGKEIAGVEKASVDTYLGRGEIIHKANENKHIQKICDVMKECGATYGIASADFETRTREYMLTYYEKGQKLDSDVGELRNYFADYFTEDDPFYKAYRAKDTAAMNKLSLENSNLMKNQLGNGE